MANIINVKNCPLLAFLRNGNIVSFRCDTELESAKLCMHKLTVESIAKISAALYIKGFDAEYICIDQSEMHYASAEEMGW